MRLADPAIAKKLALSTEQQAEIARLVAERDAAIAASDATGRPAVEARSDEQLLDVLDDDQQARWHHLARDEVRRLKFSFRFQPWADVLEWFAEQSNLSLVLDAPPPGTFNYTDTREYTVPEAIDLINGVLLTKGYTLIRRDRMLMVLNVGDGLPADLIPRVEVDELDERGRFELVSVVFPLEGRDAAEVETEIKPLLGPHGKTAVLPKTRQLLVTDMAGKMRSIAAVIASIPLPSKPAAVAPAAPGQPSLATYPLETLDPATTLEVLKSMFPDAKPVVDSKAGVLLVTALPEHQANIEKVLTQLRANAGPDAGARLESYPVKQSFKSELAQLLSPVAPGATFTIDSRTGNLLVFGNAKQQAAVERTLIQLGRQSDASDRRIEVYPLQQAEPANVLAVVQRLLPQAQVVVDTPARAIVGVVDDAEHAAIQAAIERLEKQPLEADKRTIEIYTLTGEEPATLSTILARLLPLVQVTLDSTRKQLVVVALPGEHERVKAILEQLAHPPAEELEIKLYPIQLSNVTTLSTLLTKRVPLAQVTVDAPAKRLVVLASAKDHAEVAAVLAAVEEGSAEQQPNLVVYPLNVSQSKKLQAVLTALAADFVGMRSVPDVETGHLSVWATPAQHEQVRAIMEQVTRELPESERAKIVVYPIPDADPIALASMLQSVAPTARFSGDRQNLSLAVWGTPAEHELVKPAIEAMLKRYPPGREPKLIVYPAAKAEISNLIVMLRGVVPQAQVVGDTKNGNLIAWGTAEEHAKIQATVDGLANSARDSAMVAEVYSAPATDPSTLLLVLQAAAPEARIVANAKAGNVIAWASAEQHRQLREALKSLEAAPSDDSQRTAKVYRFRTADANAALVVLRSLVPLAQLAVDTRTGSLAATALPSEHKLIETTVAELEGEGETAQNFQLQVYPLEKHDPASALAIIRDLFVQRPEVRLSLDAKGGKLVVWAPPAQQETVRKVLAGLESGEEHDDHRQVETYPLDTADSTAVSTLLTSLFADRHDVRIVTDAKASSVTVIGPPDVQASARATIEQMRGEGDEFDVIPLRVVDAYNASLAIRRLFGDPRDSKTPNAPYVESDSDAQQLSIRGTKQQLTRIRELLTKMGEPALTADGSSGPGRKMRVIPLGGRAAKSTIEEIERVWPQLRGNPIRVVTPSAVVPTMKERSSGKSESTPSPVVKPALPDSGAIPVAQEKEELLAFAFEAQQEASAVTSEKSSTDQTQNEPTPEPAVVKPVPVDPAPEAAAPDAPEAPAAEEGLPPIVISQGDDSITIASDDLEALNQFEELFKAISARHGTAGREFTVFALKRADVMVVAQTLQQLFEQRSFGFRSSDVTIVPDQRLNSLVVQANRNELATIEGLLEVLDTSETPDNIAARKPRVIPLKNSSAVEVGEVIKDTYKTQLTATNNRQRQSSATRAFSPGLAALINQINPETTGPEMTLSVDTATNSLVVNAAGPLFDEVKALAESLDASAGTGTRTVKVVPLTKTNSKAMQQALKSLFENRTRRRSQQ